MKANNVLILFMILGIGIKTGAQNSTLNTLLEAFKFKEAKEAVKKKSYRNTHGKWLDLGQIYSSEKEIDSAFYYLLKIDTLLFSSSQKARYNHYLAETYDANNEEDIAFRHYETAKKLYKTTGNKALSNLMNSKLYATIDAQEHYYYPKENYLDEFEKVAIENNFTDQMVTASLERAWLHFTVEGRDSVNFYIKRAFKINNLDNDLREARIYSYKGLYLTEITGDLDSADYHYQKAFELIKDKNIHYRLFYNYINQANVLRKRGKIREAIDILKTADSLTQSVYRKNNKKFLYALLSNDLETIGKKEEALFYLKKHIQYRDSVNVAAQNVNLTRFQAEKRESVLLLTEQKKKKNANIAIAMGIGLIGVTIIGFLLFKNTKRKQRIAEQQSEIEVRKTEKLLKEQELTSIDAMISGQEKERKRLASDLHDSVGATIAAAKLQFEYLSKNRDKTMEMDEVYSKTHFLLETAYSEVRSMAHLKNSGVIAKNGLLPAVKQLAKNASGTNKLTIEVQDFGLEERLENSLEIAIFRIIQELVTNVIKHANASEAIISITQHEDSLSIIVEDNGNGFKAQTIQKKEEGMGLSTIERRVEHLEGTMEIDSTPGKGTSILIDIPL